MGGGFIGLETVENLVNLGLSVSVVEMLTQVMPNLDPEIAAPLQESLISKGVKLHLGEAVSQFSNDTASGTIRAKTRSGLEIECDMVLLATGARPEVTLARKAGLEIGQLGGIRVTDKMQTSDDHIWAVGDAVDQTTVQWSLVPLAGPASRRDALLDVISSRCQVPGSSGHDGL